MFEPRQGGTKKSATQKDVLYIKQPGCVITTQFNCALRGDSSLVFEATYIDRSHYELGRLVTA